MSGTLFTRIARGRSLVATKRTTRMSIARMNANRCAVSSDATLAWLRHARSLGRTDGVLVEQLTTALCAGD
jgi:hypothetical protein